MVGIYNHKIPRGLFVTRQLHLKENKRETTPITNVCSQICGASLLIVRNFTPDLHKVKVHFACQEVDSHSHVKVLFTHPHGKPGNVIK